MTGPPLTAPARPRLTTAQPLRTACTSPKGPAGTFSRPLAGSPMSLLWVIPSHPLPAASNQNLEPQVQATCHPTALDQHTGLPPPHGKPQAPEDRPESPPTTSPSLPGEHQVKILLAVSLGPRSRGSTSLHPGTEDTVFTSTFLSLTRAMLEDFKSSDPSQKFSISSHRNLRRWGLPRPHPPLLLGICPPRTPLTRRPELAGLATRAWPRWAEWILSFKKLNGDPRCRAWA